MLSVRKRPTDGAPRWAAFGGNGSVVPMDSTTTATARLLLEQLWDEVDLLFPSLDPYVRNVVCVQFVATLIDLEEQKRKGL